MNKNIKEISKVLKNMGYNVDQLFSSNILSDKEREQQLASIFADIIKNQTNNSTKVNKSSKPVDTEHFYMGFVSDAHSKMYLLEDYLKLLSFVGGKCVATGDLSNGSNHYHGHDSSLNETLNLSNDVLSISDMLKRYPDMFVGYVEGNHDQWMSEGTSLYLGYLACKIAGVDEIYAKNVQLVQQKVTYQGKEVPFNFLIVHGEGMPADIVKGLKKSLETACSENVDAIIFGHTHKLGGASTTVVRKNASGVWTEKQVSSFNPGSLLEASDYADKAGYPATAPFDGSVMRCSVVPSKDGNGYKKCIDLENILDVIPEKDRATLKALDNKLAKLETRKFAHSRDIEAKYDELAKEYAVKDFKSNQFNGGQHFIAINGTCDVYSPKTSEAIKRKIKDDLKYAVSVAKDIPNMSIVLNGDLIYDYNKGYITKKDYCSKIIADLQDLCEILKPVADKVISINNGKMECSIMDVERDKGTGRLKSNKENARELANYAAQVLQLPDYMAYAHYDKEDLQSRKIAAQNDQIEKDNQKALDKAYEDFMKKYNKNANVVVELGDDFETVLNKKLDEKRIKEALVKKLRKEHKILDITNEEDRKIIDKKYPLSYVDFRMPNENLIGNIICKLLGISPKQTRVNHVPDAPTIAKIPTATGDTKTVHSYYTSSLPKFMKDLPAKLNSMSEPPDVVVVNSFANKANGDLQEFTTQVRMSYVDKNNIKRMKDVLVVDSGSFAYSKLLTTGRVPTNLIYKVVDVDQLFKTTVPKDSVNFVRPTQKRQVMEKYNYESIHNKFNTINQIVEDVIDHSYETTLRNYYAEYSKAKSKEFVAKKRAELSGNAEELTKSEE